MRRLLCTVALLPLAACNCDPEVAGVAGSIEGALCADDGAPLAGALVELERRGNVVDEALTNPIGEFVFARVAAGEISIIHPLGGLPLAATVVSGKATVVEDPRCRNTPDGPGAGGVDGEICNRHTGALVSQADVRVATSSGTLFETRTDDQGRFALAGLPDGQHVLTVSAPGFERAFLIEVVDGGTFHLEVGEECIETDAAHGTLSGTLCDPDDPAGVLIAATVVATDSTGFAVTDVTDLEGKFFINAMAPGVAAVSVTRADGVNLAYSATVVAGQDVVVVRDSACNDIEDCSFDIEVQPVSGARPIDVIFVVDDSGSMDDDNQAIGQNMNAFSQDIAGSGVDYHVTLIGTTVVPAPLGGSDRYLQVERGVGSNEPLIAVVESYAQFSAFMRADSVKHFVAITDDESDMSAGAFTSTVNTWDGFDAWKFHSIVAYGNDPDNGCSTGAAYSHQYMDLSAQTGGLTSPICGANYATVLDAVVEAVTVATLPCTIALDGGPAGSSVDPARVMVTYEGASAAVGTGPCDAAGGWRLDDESAPTAIVACPATCSELTSAAAGALSASVGCFLD